MPDLPYALDVEVVSLLASPQHRYEGRPSEGPVPARVRELHESVEVRAGLGIVGDRFFGHAAHRTASVTVMAMESLDAVASELAVAPFEPGDTRRNIMVRGVPIDALRGQDFSLDSGSGAVLFRAHRPANPCAWMDVVLAPGAFRQLRGRGGMRCEPLTSGTIALGSAVLRTAHPVAAPVLF